MGRPADVVLALGTAGLLALAMAGAAAAGGVRAPARYADPPPHPRRIVSTTLAADEILLALIEPPRLFAVTHFADDARVSNVLKEARDVPHRVSGVDPEAIVALEPDLVITGGVVLPEARELLARARVPVVDLPPASSVADVRENIRRIGALVGEREAAEWLVSELDRGLADLEARVEGAPEPRVLLWNAGNYTAGPETLQGELLELAGGYDAARDLGVRGHEQVAIERALALDPDVILVTDYRSDQRSRELVAEPSLVRDPVWASTSAVRTGRVHRLDERHAMSTSHHVLESAREVARTLHPERFRSEP